MKQEEKKKVLAWMVSFSKIYVNMKSGLIYFQSRIPYAEDVGCLRRVSGLCSCQVNPVAGCGLNQIPSVMYTSSDPEA